MMVMTHEGFLHKTPCRASLFYLECALALAFYGKLNRTEPGISEAMVKFSADRAEALLDKLDFQPWEVLPGYRCFALDGNHLQKTEKRLTETLGLCAMPLPGTVVGRFNYQTGLFIWFLEDFICLIILQDR